MVGALMGEVTRRRVVLVDDDTWIRRGQASALAPHPEIEVVADLGFAEALAWGSEWSGVDVAIVDAFQREASFDHFLGAEVVETIRKRRTANETVVVVVSGRGSDSHLRLRMAEVGADFFYDYDEIDGPETLISVILDPQDQRRTNLGDVLRLASRGISPASRPQRFLRWLHDQGVEDAFCPGLPQATTGLSRRRIMSIRAAATRIGGLGPSPGRLGGGPQPRGSDPTWREVVEFVNASRGYSPSE